MFFLHFNKQQLSKHEKNRNDDYGSSVAICGLDGPGDDQ
jgi:hypothetical protein